LPQSFGWERGRFPPISTEETIVVLYVLSLATSYLVGRGASAEDESFREVMAGELRGSLLGRWPVGGGEGGMSWSITKWVVELQCSGPFRERQRETICVHLNFNAGRGMLQLRSCHQ
jgi:hypothetical protein